MRKILVLFVLSVFSYSQKADLTSAILAFQKDDNEQAIEFIDIAYDKFMQKGLDQEKPKLISKFWFYRGEIYYKSGNLDIAVESYLNDLNLNAKGGLQKKSLIKLQECAVRYNNLAIEFYDSKDFDSSAKYFENTYNIRSNPSINVIDTASLFNASFLFYNNEDFSNSLRLSEKLVSLNSKDERYQIQHIQNLEKIGSKDDLLLAINFARAENPSSVDIIFKEVNYYLSQGDNEGLKISLDNAIKADPNNPTLYFVLGQTFQGLEESEMAEDSYLKAIELNADYFDAYNNLASIYLDETRPIIDKMNSLGMSDADQKKYTQLKNKRASLYKKALPHLENCIRINPNSLEALYVLREVYNALEDYDNFSLIRKKIAELEGK